MNFLLKTDKMKHKNIEEMLYNTFKIWLKKGGY